MEQINKAAKTLLLLSSTTFDSGRFRFSSGRNFSFGKLGKKKFQTIGDRTNVGESVTSPFALSQADDK